MPPNGLAQRQDWRDSSSMMHHSWQNAPVSERRSWCPLGGARCWATGMLHTPLLVNYCILIVFWLVLKDYNPATKGCGFD